MAPKPPPGGAAPVIAGSQIIGRWASDAGFAGDDLTTAIAVALAESGGHSDATHTNADGSVDYGAWGINDKAHADLFNQFPDWGYGPTNAQMAHAVWQSSGWDAWTTHKNGKYRDFLNEAQQGASNPNLPTQQGVVNNVNFLSGIANGVLEIAKAIFKAAAWMANPHNWGRVALVALGGGLVIGSLVVLTKPAVSAPAQIIEKVK